MTASPPARALRLPAWTSSLDLAIAGTLAAWAIVEALLIPGAPVTAQLGFALAVTLPLVVRRRFPATVMLLLGVAFVVHAATSGAHATFNPFPSLLVATFTVASHVAPLWRSALLGVVPIAAMLGSHLLGYFGTPGIEKAGALFLFFFVGATWAAGRIVRQRGLAVDRTREDVDRVAGEAVALERTRIARELHDVIAHAVSVVVLQAGAAEQFLDRDPERARKHLAITRRTAQEALEEMRHLLGVLREDDVHYAPQPGLERVPELVAETRAAGHVVRLETDGAHADVPDGVSLAGYRIVQEALTNVRKHAQHAEVTVLVQTDGERVRVAVRSSAGAPGGDTSTGGGHGILGMRERVRVYGGSIDAGPTADGGWTVDAVLPVVRS
ncbi:signal transduction histidine kinase [Diaminobutyricimonas aerilata]|uniref:histidine kinase n=1 Tax=Diaminobutyricimonas aerilata TaxID=1162967 RepID=A0A2M9CHT2_9MICO|nr:sensor histidine kinase [Diaminobutyricimonas aerilata]PJJ71447.1 signal transduction histidine kinase [Diaminobutyricimonas aerilata]